MTDPRMGETLSFLVHAGSKVGKTTLASTCPKPLLLLDAEGGSKFLPNPKVFWDPLLSPPPAYDGTWEICVVIVRDYSTMSLVFNWLITGQHHFASVCLDSISEVQRRCKESLVGTEQMKMQDWGALLTSMDHLIRGYRDLTMHPTNPLSVAMFIAETRQNGSGKWIPYMQGQISVSLPYWVDVIGYLYVQDSPDPNNPLGVVRNRCLLVRPDHQFEAGERVQGRLGEVVFEPNVERMLDAVYPKYQPQ